MVSGFIPKRIIDISNKIHPEMVVWPGDDGVSIKQNMFIKGGDLCNLSSIHIGMHVGTHVDAPNHFLDNGSDISQIDLSLYIGMAKIFNINTKGSYITEADLSKLDINKDDIILFKTSNSQNENSSVFNKDFVSIDESAAEYLINKNIKTVGIDYFSVEEYNTKNGSVHKILLSHGIGIIEGVDLREVDEGEYFLSCLPLKIEGGNGSPVRAVLIEL